MLEYKCAWYGRELLDGGPLVPFLQAVLGMWRLQENMPLNVRTWAVRLRRGP